MKIEIIKGDDNPVAKFFCSSPETDAFFLKKGSWSDDVIAFCRKMERERNDALQALTGWENKWKVAVEMAARAEVERDEAMEELKKLQESICQKSG